MEITQYNRHVGHNQNIHNWSLRRMGERERENGTKQYWQQMITEFPDSSPLLILLHEIY